MSAARLGPMDADRWMREGFQRRGARVFCDGVDITMRCTWFDDVSGRAECYTTDPPTFDPVTGDLKRESLQGRIEVIDVGISQSNP